LKKPVTDAVKEQVAAEAKATADEAAAATKAAADAIAVAKKADAKAQKVNDFLNKDITTEEPSS